MVVGAILVLIIGWFVAALIGRLIAEILKRIKFDQIFEKGGWKASLAKADIKVDPSGFIGAIVKWILIIVFLMAAVQILGINQLADFLKGILGYLPNVIAAAAIFVVTVILVDIVEKVVRTDSRKLQSRIRTGSKRGCKMVIMGFRHSGYFNTAEV